MKTDSFLENIGDQALIPYRFEALEAAAKEKLPRSHFGYIQSGAGAETTLSENLAAFDRYAMVPRMLQNVAALDTTIDLFGQTYATPLMLAPVGMLKLVHEDADLAAAKAAANYQVPFIQSTVSSYSIEEVAAAAGNSPKWFQLYWSNHEDISFSMVNRAEQAGYEAIVLTVDTIMLGWRVKDMENHFSPLKEGFGKANYETDPFFVQSLSNDSSDHIVDAIMDNIFHPSLNWEHVKKLKEQTSLPILLKGILHPDDARLAIENGVDGIIVSNHGARQLDGVITSIDALQPIAKAVDGNIPILLDSGIRTGTDVVKALALGATAVLLGRPFIYGLALDGQAGVEKVLERFIQETNIALSLAGASSVKNLSHINIQHVNQR